MLSPHGWEDEGNHWTCRPGPVPGTSLLLNLRSGCYLNVRAAWATEPKGSHLALSPDPNDGGNLWCFDPVAVAPEADGSWQHVRSTSAIVRDQATAAVGPMAKFAWGGAWQNFPGHSVVAGVHPVAREMLAHGRKLVAESAVGRTLLSAPPLPLASLHMTVCGWNELGRPESRTAVTHALEEFKRACSGEQFRACGVSVHPGSIHLQVQGVEPAEPFVALRRALQVISGRKDDNYNPNDGKLHITLGWYLLWMPVPEQETVAGASLGPANAELTQALARISATAGLRAGELPLMLPHLSAYPDMATFPHNCPV